MDRKNLESSSEWRTYKKKIDVKKLFGMDSEESIEDYEFNFDEGIVTITISTNRYVI
jgi:hypothetical protein